MIDSFKSLQEFISKATQDRQKLHDQAGALINSLPDENSRALYRRMLNKARGIKTQEDAKKVEAELMQMLKNGGK